LDGILEAERRGEGGRGGIIDLNFLFYLSDDLDIVTESRTLGSFYLKPVCI
jgi:hypothetical protein